jgi:hypothetical protein
MADSKLVPPGREELAAKRQPDSPGSAGNAPGSSGLQEPNTSVSDHWKDTKQRPPVLVKDQLKQLIQIGLTSAHGPPMSNSWYDDNQGCYNIWWKWGTFSKWWPTENKDVLLIRYCMLCANGDMTMIIPPETIVCDLVRPADEAGNEWWYMCQHFRGMVNDNIFNPEEMKELESFQELLNSRPKEPEVGNAESQDIDMTDAMHCVRRDGTPWNDEIREDHITWYLRNLLHVLRSVTPQHPGYVESGWITVNSLLTHEDGSDRTVDHTWAPGRGCRFNGDTLGHIFGWASGILNYSTLQCGNDSDGNHNTLIRVDSGNYLESLAQPDYVQVTKDNMHETCYGMSHLVYRGYARSWGLVVTAGLGLRRGIWSASPPPDGYLQEVVLELARDKATDGQVQGQFYPVLDKGQKDGHEFNGAIGYIVKVKDALDADVEIFRTPNGAYVVPNGGIDAELISSAILYQGTGDHPDGTVLDTSFLALPITKESRAMVMTATKLLVNDPDAQSRRNSTKSRWRLLEFETTWARGCLDEQNGNCVAALRDILGQEPEVYDSLRRYDASNPGPTAPEGKGKPHDPEGKGKAPRSRTPVGRGDPRDGNRAGDGTAQQRSHSKGRGKSSGKGKRHTKDRLSPTSNMTGKGRHDEAEAIEGVQGWLAGMSIRRSTYCKTLEDGTYCAHHNSPKGCGFAHSKAEIDAHAAERVIFVQSMLDQHGWSWHAYHEDNEFNPNGWCTAGPSLELITSGDHPTQKGDPRYKGTKGCSPAPAVFNAWGNK